VDVDFLLPEYDRAVPVALIDYKHYKAYNVDLGQSNYRALGSFYYRPGPVGEFVALPFFVAVYWPDSWSFYLVPANEAAQRVVEHPCHLSERDFVRFLYHLRKREVSEHILTLANDVRHSPMRFIMPTVKWNLDA
jgi:hypothetical protein